MTSAPHRPAEVIDFWFAPGRERHWFAKDPGFDREVGVRLGPLHEAAVAGALAGWSGEAAGSLALVLLLDQAPRNLFRGGPRAFASDAAARAVARQALRAGHDVRLDKVQRFFLYLPFEHSEDLADQSLSLALIAALGDAEWRRYAQAHLDIVQRFGRFPHRNEALGRISTPAEIAFLAQPGSSF